MADLNISRTDTSFLYEDSGQNLIPNGGFEDAPAFTAATTTAARWIDGTAAGSSATRLNGWAIPVGSVTASAAASFDTSVSAVGTNSMKLDLLNTSGAISVSTRRQTPAANLLYELIPMYPSSAYILTGQIKTNNTATNGAWIEVVEYSSSGSALATNVTSKLSGTNNWQQMTKSFTSNASTVGCAIILRHNVAGNISTAWFDDLKLILNSPSGNVAVPITPIVTPGVQNVSGPKIWG
jgi:hypothetical protein